jgi:hypothetical protein
LITTESHYSLPHLQRGVTVDSGELFSKTVKDSPFLKRDNEAKNGLPMKSTDHQEHFKRVKNMGYLRLCF